MTKHKHTKPRQRRPPHLTWFLHSRPYPWLKSTTTTTKPTTTSTTIDTLPDIKIEPIEVDSYNYLVTHESNQPDVHQTIDHNYSIESTQPYKLVVPKTEAITKLSKSTQCCIKSTQCCIKPNETEKKNVAIQCKIKPQPVDSGVQCSTRTCNAKTNTDFRVLHKNASTQANILRQFNGSNNNNNNVTKLTTINVYMNGCMSRVAGIVEQTYPSLHTSVLPNRLEIIRKDLMDIPCEGKVPCKILVHSTGKATVTTTFRKMLANFDVSDTDELKFQLFKLSDEGKHLFCPGLDAWYEDIAEKTDLVEKMKWPCERIQSKKCLEWYEASRNLPLKCIIKPGVARCCHCSKLQSYLKVRKLNPATEEQKLKRTDPSSHCTLRCLSPESLKRRKIAVTKRRQTADKDGLDSEEYEELVKIVNLMAEDKTLQESLLSPQIDCLKGNLGQFSKLKALIVDQKLNKAHDGKSNRWSTTTMKLALDIYQRSPAAYHRLRSLKLLKLPCVRQLKRIKSRKKAESCSASANYSSMEEQEEEATEEDDEQEVDFILPDANANERSESSNN